MSNSVLLPIVGMLTCIVVGFVIRPQAIIDEVEINDRFKVKKFYTIMVKWIAPIFILVILITSVLQGLGWIVI